MTTPSDTIDLRDYFAAAALSGIIFDGQTRNGGAELSVAEVESATARAYSYASTVIAKRAALRVAEGATEAAA